MENVRRIPVHVAIIMDGNGRWAKKRGLPRTAGHAQGARTVEKILEDADHMGIKYLTVYAFSTENWSRPDSEVKALMNLLRTYMKTSLAKCAKKNNLDAIHDTVHEMARDEARHHNALKAMRERYFK